MFLFTLVGLTFASSFTEDFGTLQSSCSSQWSDDCEVGWTAHGPANRLSICDDGASEIYLAIDSTNAQTSSVSRVVTLQPEDEYLEWTADTVVETAGTVKMTAVFRDASGTIVHTVNEQRSLTVGDQTLTLIASRPSAAVSAQLRFGGADVNAEFRARKLGLLGDLLPSLADSCQIRAKIVEGDLRAECEAKGPWWVFHGECTGTSVPGTFISGCEIECPVLACRDEEPDSPVPPTCL